MAIIAEFKAEEIDMMLWSFSSLPGPLTSAWTLLRKAESAGQRIGTLGMSAMLMESEQRELDNFELRLLARLARGPLAAAAFNVAAGRSASGGGANRARRLLQQAAATARLRGRSKQT